MIAPVATMSNQVPSDNAGMLPNERNRNGESDEPQKWSIGTNKQPSDQVSKESGERANVHASKRSQANHSRRSWRNLRDAQAEQTRCERSHHLKYKGRPERVGVRWKRIRQRGLAVERISNDDPCGQPAKRRANNLTSMEIVIQMSSRLVWRDQRT